MHLFSDVAQNIYMEATLRQPDWQTRVAKTSTKAMIKGALALQKASERDENRSSLANSSGSRKNIDTSHPAIKKMSQKKFKLVANSTYILFISKIHFLF